MFVVDGHALGVVHLLYFLHQVDLDLLRSHDPQDVLRIELSFSELLAGPHLVAVLDPDSGGGRHRIFPLLRLLIDDGDFGGLPLPALKDHATAEPGCDLLSFCYRGLFGLLLSLAGRGLLAGEHCVLVDSLIVLHQKLSTLGNFVLVAVELGAADGDLAQVPVPADLGCAIDLRHHALYLGCARLEQALHARQAAGDVEACHSSGVEGPHGELGTGLADALGGDNAYRRARLYETAGGGATPIAEAADAPFDLADESRADVDSFDV